MRGGTPAPTLGTAEVGVKRHTASLEEAWTALCAWLGQAKATHRVWPGSGYMLKCQLGEAQVSLRL